MQPYTGETFLIPDGPRAGEREHVGKLLDVAELEARAAEMRESAVAGHEVTPVYDLDAAIRSAREHGPLVGVTGEVAQAQRVGRRELERRATRRKAAKRARKRNR